MYMGAALGVQRGRQLYSRPTAANEFTQVSRANMPAGQKLDGRDIGTDRVEVVAGSSFGQRTRTVRINHDGRTAELGRPATIRTAVDDGAVADAIGGDHNGAGDLDFLLVERRGHGDRSCGGRAISRKRPRRILFYIGRLKPLQRVEYSTKVKYGHRRKLSRATDCAKLRPNGRWRSPQFELGPLGRHCHARPHADRAV